ncbi:MAG: class I SAM-dependent methyltransferase [Saprospiraceae bacterium]|nr:class I SAM-dependent methyltransferase [Saprospiraceae bacterium]MDZ4706526.1 class I SAM-dependent methyltransferase [Saprospiraceae bacterium]
MELSAAIELIQNVHLPQPNAAIWCDLGCGSGLFTFALAHLLKAGSTVYAVDKTPIRLSNFSQPDDMAIHAFQLDFETTPLPLRDLDGILMANSMHYVQDKGTLIRNLSACLKPGGNFLIVEYDTDTPVSHWVPYPVGFRTLKQLFASVGYAVTEKVGERDSVYGRANLYAAWVA